MTEIRDSNRNGWKIAGVAALVLACLAAMGLGRYAYPVILPDMQRGLGLSYAHMGTIGTANMAGYLVFAFLGGALGDRYRPKMIILICLLFLAGAMVLMGRVSSYYTALILMFVAGMGTGGTYVLSQAQSKQWWPVCQGNRRYICAFPGGGGRLV
ncbi:MAG: MFS transporter [Clostridia bacterium]|nr:MAG: MFS transporter [Clostridia bacterium]